MPSRRALSWPAAWVGERNYSCGGEEGWGCVPEELERRAGRLTLVARCFVLIFRFRFRQSSNLSDMRFADD